MSKETRHTTIQALVRRTTVRTQADLRQQLERRGFRVDQSTLSRDLNELGIRKSGGRYLLPGVSPEDPRRRMDYRPFVVAIASCGSNVIVVRTKIGFALPIALCIEAKEDPSILATLAGDDTIFVTTKSRHLQSVALRQLSNWFGEENGR